MSSLFKHTIQPVGSSTSPVEDLALEVDQAFSELEGLYNTEPKLLNTFREAIGNTSLEDLLPHKVTKDFSEVHTVLSRESTITLKAIPEVGSVSISYMSDNNSLVVLSEVDSVFTTKDQFKVVGKDVKLNLYVDNLSSKTVSVVYRGEVLSLGGKKFLPNVFKNSTGVFKIKPTIVDNTTFKLIYDRNINDLIEEFKTVPGKEISIFSTENGEDWSKVKLDSYSINGNEVEFVTQDLQVKDETFLSVFIENTSIGAVLNALYKEFVEHTHNSEGLTNSVNSYDLSNRVVNNEKISYKTDDEINYQFPQYFNREGYNPNLNSVYENSILGDVFVSREFEPNTDKYKGLDKDSYKIRFGDPVLGHTLGYNREHRSTLLTSVENLNGLKIQVLDPSKWNLSLNKTEMYSTDEGFKIKPQNNTVDLVSEDRDKLNTLKVDNLVVGENANMHNVRVHSYKINDVWFKEAANKVDAEVVPIPNLINEEAKLYFNLPTIFKDFNVSEGKFNKLHFGKVSLNKTDEDELVFSSTDDKKITFEPEVVLNDINIQSGSIKTVAVGDILLSEEETSGNEKNLFVSATSPDAKVKVKAKTILDNVDLVESNVIGNLNVGDVRLHTNPDRTLEFSSDQDKEVIFNTPVVFKNVTTDASARVALAVVDSDSLVIGNNKLHKTGENTSVSPINNTVDTEFRIESDSYLKNTVADRLSIKDGEVTNTLRLGTSTLAVLDDGKVLVEPEDFDTGLITVKTKVDASKAVINNLEVTEELKLKSGKFESSNFGKVNLRDVDEELVVTSEDDKRVVFKAPVVLDSATISDITVVGGNLSNTQVKGMKIGDVTFDRDDDSNGVKVIREGTDAKYLINVPTEVQDLTAVSFNTTGKSNMADLEATSLTLGGVKFTVGEHDVAKVVNKETLDPKELNVEVDSNFSNLTAKTFSTPLYTLYNKDKIELNATNYLYNKDGRLALLNDKALSYIGSDKNSGIQFSHGEDTSFTVKQYVSANAGTKAVETERNYFFETDTTNGVYFIRNTNSKVSVNGTIYGFNDSTAQRNISDLTKWFRSDLFIGKLDGTSANLMTADSESRNGLTIGSTRLSVIGPGTSCPEGLTVLESGDSIHLVQPMSENGTCRDLTYQEVNTGALNVKGSTSVDGSITVTEDIVSSGTVASDNLIATGDTEVFNLAVSGTLKVGDKATFNNEVEFQNPLSFKNEVVSESIIKAKHLEATGSSEFGKSVEIKEDLDVTRDVAVGGELVVKQDIRTDGLLSARGGITSTNVNFDSVRVTGDTYVQNTLSVQGITTFKNSVKAESDVEINTRLLVKDSITADNIYAIEEVYSRGKLTALDGAEIKGQTINIGEEKTILTISGKLQMNTSDVTLNSPLKVFEDLSVAGDLNNTGKLINKAGIETDSYLKVVGALDVDSNANFGSEVRAKSLVLTQTATIGGSVVANSVTTESIAVDNTATIAHLNITGSLTTTTGTRLNAGETHVASLTVSDAKSESSVAGKLTVSGAFQAFSPAKFSDSITVGTNSVVIDNSGIKVPSGKIESKSFSGESLEGVSRISAPPVMVGSSNRIVSSIANTIPNKGFIKLNNFVTEGVAIFNNPVVVDTLFFRDMIFLEDARDLENKAKGVNITARRAIYS